jgi:hypothetical protein
MATQVLTNSFLRLFQNSLKSNLKNGILKGKGFNDSQSQQYTTGINTLSECQLSTLLEYIQKAKCKDDGEYSPEYHILRFVCEKCTFNYNRTPAQTLFKLILHIIFLTITDDNLSGSNILHVLHIQMLLRDFNGDQLESETMIIINLCLELCKKQECHQSSKEFFNFKQNLVLIPGKTQDCNEFNELPLAGHAYYMSVDKAITFQNFLDKHYPGLSKFVRGL